MFSIESSKQVFVFVPTSNFIFFFWTFKSTSAETAHSANAYSTSLASAESAPSASGIPLPDSVSVPVVPSPPLTAFAPLVVQKRTSPRRRICFDSQPYFLRHSSLTQGSYVEVVPYITVELILIFTLGVLV